MKVHRLTVLIIDFDDVGAIGCKDILQETRYPNDCIGPRVLKIETRETKWDGDDHPLNCSATQKMAVRELFGDRYVDICDWCGMRSDEGMCECGA